MSFDRELMVFTLRLSLEGPVFVGSGGKISKKEYYFSPKSKKVRLYHPEKFQKKLLQFGKLVDSYESYMLSGNQRTLYDFFSGLGYQEAWVEENFHDALAVEIDSGQAIIGEGQQPADICTFIRDAYGNPYLPGSSVKGMLRTALTIASLSRAAKVDRPSTQVDARSLKKEAGLVEKKLDRELFGSIQESLFRGLSVPDSIPLSNNDLILCRKADVDVFGEIHEINLVRECLRPGLVIDIPITIDKEISNDCFLPKNLLKAVRVFDDTYRENCLCHFSEPKGGKLPSLSQHLFLGGGSGYFDKTVTMPWLGEEDGLEYVGSLMKVLFPKGGHEGDSKRGVSPHTLKYTRVNGRFLPFGTCRVECL